MALVADLAGIAWRDGRTVDKPLATVNRWVSGNPNAAQTPQYTGEIIVDTTTAQAWRAGNLLNTGWMPIVIND